MDDESLMGRVTFGSVFDSKPSPENDEFSKLYKADTKDCPEFVKGFLNDAKDGGSKQYEDEGISLYNAANVAVPPYNMAHLAKLYDASSFHATAVDAKIDNTVGLGYIWELTHVGKDIKDKAETSKTKDKLKKVAAKLEEVKRDLDSVVNGMNSTDELEEILVKILKDRHTTGNGYMEIGRTLQGKINYIGHIPSKDIRVRRSRDGFVQVVNNKNIFFRNFGDRDTKNPFKDDNNPNELLHWKFYSPVDDFYGVPEIISASQALAGIEFAQRFNIDYFENKAVPRYIIKTKGIKLSDSQQKDLLRFFETNTKGASHRTVMVPLPAGQDKDIDFHPVETGRQDASFTEYIKLNLQIILSRHRVPQGRVGITSASTSAAESAASEKTFKETVCRPEARLIEKKFNKVIKELTDLFEFKLNEFTLTDEDQQSQIDERYLRWGVKVPDEIRNSLGMQPRADGEGMEPVDTRTVGLEQAAANAKAGVSGSSTNNWNNDNNAKKAEDKAQNYKTRTRDAERTSHSPDSASNSSTRRVQGQGSNPNS